MVYVFGIIGFIGGFALGLMIISIFLKKYNKYELVKTKSLRWTYGLAVWIVAGLGAWAAVWAHGRYFY